MSGYDFWPMVRYSVDDNTPTTIDLRSDLTSVAGPIRIRGPQYVMQQIEREDVNRVDRRLRLGHRVSVGMDFEVHDDMLDHDYFADILDAWNRGDKIELSLDGGATWRTVEITAYQGPTALSGKPRAGALFSLDFRCIELIDTVPRIASGSW